MATALSGTQQPAQRRLKYRCEVENNAVISHFKTCPKYFGKRPHRYLVTPRSDERIRPPRSLGRHIRL